LAAEKRQLLSDQLQTAKLRKGNVEKIVHVSDGFVCIVGHYTSERVGADSF